MATSELAPAGPGRRLWEWRWRALALLVVVGLTGLALALNARNGQQKAAPIVAAGPQPIIAQAGVVPRVERKLSFGSAGTLAELAVKVGDKVTAGQVLARLDQTDLDLKLQEAEANLDLQKATIAQESEAAPSADVAAAQAALDNARAQYQKVTSPPTASDVAAAQASVRSAQSQLATAQQKLSDLKAQPKPDDVKAAELAVDQAKNALWAQQVSRDGTCGTFGSNSVQCKSANANVAAQETAVQTAQTNLDKAQQPATSDELSAAQQSVTSAQASVDSAKTQLAQVQAGPTAADKAAAQSQIDQAAANLRSAQAKLDQLQAGPTDADREAARNAVQQAQDGLDKLTRDASPATVQLGQAKINAAEVAVKEAQRALDEAVVRAPIDGVVTSIDTHAGEVVGPASPVLTVADLTTLEFQTKDLDEISAAKVFVGQTAKVTIAALDKRTFTGTVTRIDPEPSISPSGDVNYVATIVLKDPPPQLSWGQTARVEFEAK